MNTRLPGRLTLTRRYYESVVITPHPGIRGIEELFERPIIITVLPPDRWPQSPRLVVEADRRLAVLRQELLDNNGGILLPRGVR